ncbi:MAG: hypothetical protein FVQ83_00185 [Chloroflexi bacterium]|nr:hypothetical protein [Chloroflexota bacterium]
MKCPSCNHVSDKALLKCSSCGEFYESELLENLHNAEYVIDWLDEQRQAGQMGVKVYIRLRRQAQEQLGNVQTALQPPEEVYEPARSAEDVSRELGLVEANLDNLQEWIDNKLIDVRSGVELHQYFENQVEKLTEELAGRLVGIGSITELEIIDYALDNYNKWQEEGGLAIGRKLFIALIDRRLEILHPPKKPKPAPVEKPEPSPAAQKIVTPVRPVEKVVMPAPKPKPKHEPYDWGKLMDKVVNAFVSGAVLRGVLYLGAFMIVVSAFVLVVRFFGDFPDWLQLIVIFSVPATFTWLAGS